MGRAGTFRWHAFRGCNARSVLPPTGGRQPGGRAAANAGCPCRAAPPAGVAVDFQIPYHCRYGQHVCVVGNADKLGGWEVARAVEMNWSDGDMWKVVVEFPAPRWGRSPAGAGGRLL